MFQRRIERFNPSAQGVSAVPYTFQTTQPPDFKALRKAERQSEDRVQQTDSDDPVGASESDRTSAAKDA